MTLTQLYCDVDDFCQKFMPEWEKTQLKEGDKKRLRKRCLSLSEIMTLVICHHQSSH